MHGIYNIKFLLKKSSTYVLGHGVAISAVLHPQINSTEVFKISSTFYLAFARERVKRRFLISNVSAGNMG
jgi:hypothetical protein